MMMMMILTQIFLGSVMHVIEDIYGKCDCSVWEREKKRTAKKSDIFKRSIVTVCKFQEWLSSLWRKILRKKT